MNTSNDLPVTNLPATNLMNWIILRRSFLLIPLMLVCLSFTPIVRAVSPPPDGGYVGQNTAEGTDALFSLTSGVWNVAVGFQALHSDTTGTQNTAVGYQTLFTNTTGSDNVAVGFRTLYSNTSGNRNTGVGYRTLTFNDADDNTAIGWNALYNNRTGIQNTAVGSGALLYGSGSMNTATGWQALYSNTTGGGNVANGRALYSNTTGASNTANGDTALYFNTTGSNNTADGAAALESNTAGAYNTASGERALQQNTTGSFNTAVGLQALLHNATGSYNIALGNYAGLNLTSGDNNIDIGNLGVAGDANTIRIGTAGTHTAIDVAGIYGTPVSNGALVYINAFGQLGTGVSSARFKQNIQAMGDSSDVLLSLRPVTFRYTPELDREGIRQFGLVAEEVEKVDPDLVTRDAKGDLYTVRYEAVNAMLLNEFLKAHRKMEEQEATIAQLKSTVARQETAAAQQQKQIEALTAGLQKVSAQVEMSRHAPQTVLISP